MMEVGGGGALEREERERGIERERNREGKGERDRGVCINGTGPQCNHIHITGYNPSNETGTMIQRVLQRFECTMS